MDTQTSSLYLTFEESPVRPNENNFAFVPPRITDDDAFWEFCQKNPTLRIERDETGEVTIMPPSGWDTGVSNNEIGRQLGNWNIDAGEPGYVAASSAGYRLPNRHDRAPDASWTRRYRIDALPAEQREKFAPLCPDFVIKLMSPSDSLTKTQEKMEDFIANGTLLGWLIDRKNRTIYVYRPDNETETLVNPSEVSADPELPGFILSLKWVF